jgi:type VI secretion system protein VasD
MIARKLCLIVIVALMTSCGGKNPPPPAPKPTHLIMDIEASGNLNPNVDGQPSPLLVKFYELKSLSAFTKADFMALYDKDQGTLGSELVQKHEVILQPNEKKTLHFEPTDDTRAIGAFAVFRKYEQARWRASVNFPPHETTVVHVSVGANSLDMQ